METLEATITTIDAMLNTKRKRHILGGTLMSLSLFFGGLAFTVMSLKGEKRNEN